MSSNELYHHGVKGQKWGVRRTPVQLGYRVDKLGLKNRKLSASVDRNSALARKYSAKSAATIAKDHKYTKRLTKAENKAAKYQAKADKEACRRFASSERKTGDYAIRAKQWERRAEKAKSRLNNNKWTVKSKKAQAAAEKAKQAIKKNEVTMRTYNNTIKGLNDGTIQQGRLFMKYITK